MSFKELQDSLDERISAAKITGFWSTNAKKEWINQAGQRVCDFMPWEAIKLALCITTEGGREYYDYPEQFKYNSIYNIVIEDEDYGGNSGRSRYMWDDYQKSKNLELTDLIFTNHNKWYMLNPVPENGKKMSLYGLRRWSTLTADADEPILPTEFDEAIVRIALSSCYRKAKMYDEARAELAEIVSPEGGLLMNVWRQELSEGPRGYGGTVKVSRW